jgi:diadenosine tetraphosphate (Ap4A) HIT family hydrolase
VTKVPGCPLCDAAGGHIVFAGDKFRLVRADEDGFPAFYRVVWKEHVAEFSDLAPADRIACMEAVVQVERVLRAQLAPAKVNLAALGNVVPHLHWHVIARFDWDSRFPAPVWAAAAREVDAARVGDIVSRRPALEQALADALSGGSGNCTAS